MPRRSAGGPQPARPQPRPGRGAGAYRTGPRSREPQHGRRATACAVAGGTRRRHREPREPPPRTSSPRCDRHRRRANRAPRMTSASRLARSAASTVSSAAWAAGRSILDEARLRENERHLRRRAPGGDDLLERRAGPSPFRRRLVRQRRRDEPAEARCLPLALTRTVRIVSQLRSPGCGAGGGLPLSARPCPPALTTSRSAAR